MNGDASDRLDRAFMALSDPVRRDLVARLSRGPATVNELAEPFPITKQAVSKHIRVLEEAGIVTRSRDAQRRPVHLDASTLESLTTWIDTYRLIHEARYRRLDAVLDTLRLDATKSDTTRSDPKKSGTPTSDSTRSAPTTSDTTRSDPKKSGTPNSDPTQSGTPNSDTPKSDTPKSDTPKEEEK